MTRINPRVFELLQEDEKTAVGLQYGLQKSSWESGEIMGKSHYKYLEIKYRAEKFIKLFTEHFELYDEVAPPWVEGTKWVIEYLGQCIEKRIKPSDVYITVKEKYPTVEITKIILNEKINEHFTFWFKSGNPHSKVFANLVKEFDRWNNYRILPPESQEPSAFKRRIKKLYIKHLRVLLFIPEISLDYLAKQYGTKRKPNYYWPYLVDGSFKVVKVKSLPGSIEQFTSLALYLFEDEETAKEYIITAIKYLYKEDRDCKDGLEFWPLYREIIKKAINYNQVQNIVPQRKYLELAMAKLNFI